MSEELLLRCFMSENIFNFKFILIYLFGSLTALLSIINCFIYTVYNLFNL